MRDIRYAVRTLFRSPLFAFVALLTLALGIGANAVMFSIANALLLRPLPYPDASRLLSLTTSDPARGIQGLNVSFTRLEFIAEHARTLDGIAGLFPTSVGLHTTGDPEQVPSAIVTRTFFDVLGARLQAGRTFLAEEDRAGGAEVGILSDAFWRKHFAGRADVIGQALAVDGKDVTIVGILPADFRFPFLQPEPQIWFPRVFENGVFTPDRVRSGAAYLTVFAHVRAGETDTSVKAELATLTKSYIAVNPGIADSGTIDTVTTPLQEALVGPVRTPLLVLFGATGLVLLIGCVNLASLLLARASARQREFALRRALGASSGSIFRQLLIESLLLTAAGCVAALWLASNAPLLLNLLPAGTIPPLVDSSLDVRVVLFSIALSALSALAFAVIPARRASNGGGFSALKEAGRGFTAGRRAGRSRAIVIVAEIAIALVLVSSAGLLLKSFNHLLAVDPGFDARNVTAFTVALPAARYPDLPRQSAFYRRLVEGLRNEPAIESVSVNSYLPIGGGTRFNFVCPQGTACLGGGRDPVVAVRHITADYFNTMRIPLVRGRVFTDHDDAGSSRVCVINEKAAADFFPNQDPIGKVIVQTRGNIATEIVGIVRDVRALGLNGQLLDEFYVPFEQSLVPLTNMSVIVRSTSAAAPLIASARAAVARLDADLPLANIVAMDHLIASSVSQPWLTSRLTGVFALLALALAAIGIYGVIGNAVAERKKEFAIRLALGAVPEDIRQSVLRQIGWLVGIGLGVGLIGSIASAQLLKTILFNVSPRDPANLALVTLVLVVVSLAAAYFPTRRAMRVDPITSLRAE